MPLPLRVPVTPAKRENEGRRSERLMVSIPIRVMGFDKASGEFTEDTHTVTVNRHGARIALHHSVVPGEEIRVVNLQNYSEADFRVVGLVKAEKGGVNEWGVECLDTERNMWSIEFGPPISAAKQEAGALLECQGCHKRQFWPINLVDAEVLGSAGRVLRTCSQCSASTYWTAVDDLGVPQNAPAPVKVEPEAGSSAQAGATVQPATVPSAPAVGPVEQPPEGITRDFDLPDAVTVAVQEKKVERRAEKRLVVKLPILIRNGSGQSEVTKTDNVSRHGVGVSLSMELQVGEIVVIACPYSPTGPNIEQRAEVRHRMAFAFNEKRRYGFHYLS